MIDNGSVTEGLNWTWITLMAVAPLPVALAVAFPIWRAKQPILGNLAGTAIIFGTALALILRESVEIAALVHRCLDAGYSCWPHPPVIVRHAVYATIGFVQVIALFMISLKVEKDIRRQHYSPEWR